MPRSRKYDDLFPYGAPRPDDENVEPIANGAARSKGGTASSGRVPLQPPSKGPAATVQNSNSNGKFDFMEGTEADRKRRILVREREDELTQKLAHARRQAKSGSSDDITAAQRAEKMVNVNRAATSKSRSDWVGVGIVINDPPGCEILGISPHAQTTNGVAYAPIRDDRVCEINEVPLEDLSVAEVRGLIVGPPGTAVHLTIERWNGEPLAVSLVRKHVGSTPPRPCAPRPKPKPAHPAPKPQPKPQQQQVQKDQKQAQQPAQQPNISSPPASAIRKEDVQMDIARMTGMTPRTEPPPPAKPDSARNTQGGLFVYQGRVVRQRQSKRAGGRVTLVELVEVSTGTVVYQGDGIPLGEMTAVTSGAEGMNASDVRREALQEQRRAIPVPSPTKRVAFNEDDDDDDAPPAASSLKPHSTRQQPPQPFLARQPPPPQPASKPPPPAPPPGLGQLRSGHTKIGDPSAPTAASKPYAPNAAYAQNATPTPVTVAKAERERGGGGGAGWNAGAIMCLCVGERGAPPRGGAGTLRQRPPSTLVPAPKPAPPPPPQRGILRGKPSAVEPRAVEERNNGGGRGRSGQGFSESGTFSAALGVPQPPDALERGFTNMFRHAK